MTNKIFNIEDMTEKELRDLLKDTEGLQRDIRSKLPPPTEPMKTPLPYYGGKSRLAKRIVDLMPAHQCYVEPFSGGLAVLFKKGLPEDWTSGSHYREVINDIDEEIVEFWRALQDPNHDFHDRIKYTLYSKKEHELARNEKSAWATWVSTVQSFSKIKGGGWARDKPNKRGDKNAPLTFLECVFTTLPMASERLRGAYIESEDALDLIRRWDTPYTLHYCDPPYPETTCSPYKESYTVEDYQRLIDTLAECKGSIMLSGYPLDGLKIPDDWVKYEYKATCSLSSAHEEGSPRTEVLYVCDRSKKAIQDGAIMWSPTKGWFNKTKKKAQKISLTF